MQSVISTCIACFKTCSNGDWGGFFKFSFYQRLESIKRKNIKISQFTKLGVLLLDWNYVEGFQNLEKLDTLYEFGGRHPRIGFI